MLHRTDLILSRTSALIAVLHGTLGQASAVACARVAVVWCLPETSHSEAAHCGKTQARLQQCRAMQPLLPLLMGAPAEPLSISAQEPASCVRTAWVPSCVCWVLSVQESHLISRGAKVDSKVPRSSVLCCTRQPLARPTVLPKIHEIHDQRTAAQPAAWRSMMVHCTSRAS